MADDSFANTSTSAANATGRVSPLNAGNAPPGFGLRRAATVGQPASIRRRSTLNAAGSPTGENGFADIRRRSSTYSDLETSADELFNPSKAGSKVADKSPFVYLPLTLALLPAVAGIFFENGSAFFTDLILLSLAAVFLHWSVTQPWDWYQSAQQMRVIRDEIMTEPVFDSDSDSELPAATDTAAVLDEVPEETGQEKESDEAGKKSPDRRGKHSNDRRAAALRELYLHELAALAWCFAFPMLGAYLLHTIRGQLSRPSEGLVSDYNLTIFICAAEIRPVSHLIRMLQNRTLRIQRIVANNPYEKQVVTMEQIEALSSRLDDLAAHGSPANGTSNTSTHPDVPPPKLVETAVAKEIRSTIQPELDALNRAMRRYEKKLTLLACQTDNRIEYVDYRLNDAIALAAVAAKNSKSQWGLGIWFFEKIIMMVLLPVQAVMAVFTFPFRTVSALLSRTSRSSPERSQRAARNGKMPTQNRNGSNRVPTRVSRR
ncbi:hypothetical protein F4821DRAFT_224348 [Hypoxylon rubiginosum]|uniref:Uncharacterized protein n=1 Tax=Hypoxylon rubiginosum TaxID=110542 RepID=A0ACC0DI87_9PEZI|nr:hypothetical protein F4821DRAFT_224348 [Hypoxylon rubiginosum]